MSIFKKVKIIHYIEGLTVINLKIKPMLQTCQKWDLNPRPFGPVPETGALDRSAILTVDMKTLDYYCFIWYMGW